MRSEGKILEGHGWKNKNLDNSNRVERERIHVKKSYEESTRFSRT